MLFFRAIAKKNLVSLLLVCTALFAPHAVAVESEAGMEETARQSWFARIWQPVETAYTQGTPELFLPLYTYHLRFAYSREKIDTYQEHPYGIGFGRGRYDEKGNLNEVYVMGFQDSHFKPQWMVGYAWRTFWSLTDTAKLGLGYTAFVTTRSDINHYVPFPGVLPVASLHYRKASLETAYVPGGNGDGNIFFVWGKWRFEG